MPAGSIGRLAGSGGRLTMPVVGRASGHQQGFDGSPRLRAHSQNKTASGRCRQSRPPRYLSACGRREQPGGSEFRGTSDPAGCGLSRVTRSAKLTDESAALAIVFQPMANATVDRSTTGPIGIRHSRMICSRLTRCTEPLISVGTRTAHSCQRHAMRRRNLARELVKRGALRMARSRVHVPQI